MSRSSTRTSSRMYSSSIGPPSSNLTARGISLVSLICLDGKLPKERQTTNHSVGAPDSGALGFWAWVQRKGKEAKAEANESLLSPSPQQLGSATDWAEAGALGQCLQFGTRDK